MKVLSLLQPWASLVVIGAKQIETRSWSTDHRGELLIHASLGKAGALISKEPPFTKFINDFQKLPFGAIIGKVNLIDILTIGELGFASSKINQLSLEEKAFGDYNDGRYAWMLSDEVQFDKPIPVKGSLRLWDFEL
ncbi:MAG: ASCH domain-containing protein [Chitinophagaceae bacterium]